MKILIQVKDNNIETFKDLSDPKDREEIAHIVCELDLIKLTVRNL